jgi:hypothetical protein
VRLHEHLKEKRNLLKEVGPAAAARASAAAGTDKAGGALDTEAAKAVRARGRGLLTQRIQSAKLRVADGKAASVSDPLSWEEIADCCMQLFYQHQPHLDVLETALKAYNRVVRLHALWPALCARARCMPYVARPRTLRTHTHLFFLCRFCASPPVAAVGHRFNRNR